MQGHLCSHLCVAVPFPMFCCHVCAFVCVYLCQQQALRLQLQLNFVFLVVQELLQLQVLQGGQRAVVLPVDCNLHLPRLKHTQIPALNSGSCRCTNRIINEAIDTIFALTYHHEVYKAAQCDGCTQHLRKKCNSLCLWVTTPLSNKTYTVQTHQCKQPESCLR